MKSKLVIVNILWRFAERCGAQGVGFIVSMILARLLAPELYGTIALVLVFTNILSVFVDSGLGNALIQKSDADELDFSTVFYANVLFCLTLYLLLYLAAPLLAHFYSQPELEAVIRVLGLTLIISGLKNVQQAYVSRNMLFKRFFFATLGGTVIAALVGIGMAYYGFGVWALVAQNLINCTLDTCILWISVPWRPKWMFSLERLKGLFRYGSKFLLSGLLDTLYNNLRQLVIGKLYTSEDLAFYNKGDQLPHLFIVNINSSIDSVLLPTMSQVQDDRQRVKEMTRKSITTSIYIMAPMMMGLSAVAPNLIQLLLTEKWMPCIPYLRIFCVSYIFYPIHTANLNAIKAMGRSDIFLKLEIIKKIMGLSVLLVSMWYGPLVMAYSTLISSFLSQIINSYPNKKLLEYRYLEQLKDIAPCVLLAVGMGVIASLLGLLNLPIIPLLSLQVITGAAFYLAGSEVLKLDAFSYLWTIAKSYLRRA